jgi:hypothetical protein
MLVGDDMLRVLRLKAVVTCAEGHLSMFMSMQNQDTSWSSLLCIPFQGSWTSKIKLGGTQIIQIHIRDWQIHMIVVQITYIYISTPKVVGTKASKNMMNLNVSNITQIPFFLGMSLANRNTIWTRFRPGASPRCELANKAMAPLPSNLLKSVFV